MDLKLEKTETPEDYEATVLKMANHIMASGNVDYEMYKEELRGLSVRLDNVFSPQELANDLAKIQGLKDRAIEIVRILTENYLVQKRAIEILTQGWSKYSQEKSADKRTGEAQLKLSGFIMESVKAEFAYKHALGVMRNLESQQETVSRQISCVQAAAKILDRRYAYDPDRPEDRDIQKETRSAMLEAGANLGIDPQLDVAESDPVTDWDKLPNE